MKKLFNFAGLKSRLASVAKNEVSSSIYIPYSHHWNGETILTKNKDFVTVIKVNGFSFETADDDEVDAKKQVRNNLLKGLGAGKFTIYFHTVRKKHSSYPDGSFDDFFCQEVNEQWREKNDKQFTFINEHYITVLRKNNKITEALAKLGNRLSKSEDSQTEEAEMIDAYQELVEVRDRVCNTFSSYKAKVLGCYEKDGAIYSEILEFFGLIVNCVNNQKYLMPSYGIDRYIQSSRLYFGANSIECKSFGGSRFAAIISLKNYRPTTYAGILDAFLHLPFELIISQSFSFIDKTFAINKMQLQQRRMIQAEDPSISQVAEITSALDSAMAGEYAFGYHHLTVMIIADSKKELDDAVSYANVEFTNIGINSVRERINMEACFWAQLPGNQEYAVRKAIINTKNLAGFASLHNYPEGKIRDNHWGDAVTVFNTTSGTPYFFSFHVRDVGHTMIVGPTGAGKTVLMNFLCAQAQKFRPRLFFFDKDRGAEIFVRAIGGKYSTLDVAEHSGFNPLQLPDTYENRAFLVEWLGVMCTRQGQPLSAQDEKIIQQAVEGSYNLPFEQRKLSNIAPFFGIEGPGTVAGNLAQWHSLGQRAKLFDNEKDVVDFSIDKIFGFEMGEILKDSVSLAPALMYLFHRINQSLDGQNTMIVLDEAWALIDNPVFGPRIKNWLKVLRKLNAMVVFATQSVEDATKSSISDTLVQQTATQIFLPNLRATETYRSVFMLSAREYDIIKTTDPATRYFLIKQDNNAVITKIDLTHMDDAIAIFSGRAETVAILDEIMAQVGEVPIDWIPAFLKKVNSGKNKS